uniref:Uncharacterized protein n=1 Tax=Anguilla anguilla TaxID=7936 RepID=A0A0E9TGG6_ANGAN
MKEEFRSEYKNIYRGFLFLNVSNPQVFYWRPKRMRYFK